MTRLSKREQQLADYQDEVGPPKDEAKDDAVAKIIEQQIQANLNTIVDSGNPLMDMF